jgi:hypothetical protein
VSRSSKRGCRSEQKYEPESSPMRDSWPLFVLLDQRDPAEEIAAGRPA